MEMYLIRPMEVKDIHQVVEVERQSFPMQPQPTAFRHELHKQRSLYLVAYRNSKFSLSKNHPECSEKNRFTQLKSVLKYQIKEMDIFSNPEDLIVGFIGTWYVDDEVHIISLGVRTKVRKRGIGELLLMATMEKAKNTDIKTATLEVRSSNIEAIALYEKYGFREYGVRQGYYVDNREDALIMTNDWIQTPRYSKTISNLKIAYRQRQICSNLKGFVGE